MTSFCYKYSKVLSVGKCSTYNKFDWLYKNQINSSQNGFFFFCSSTQADDNVMGSSRKQKSCWELPVVYGVTSVPFTWGGITLVSFSEGGIISVPFISVWNNFSGIYLSVVQFQYHSSEGCTISVSFIWVWYKFSIIYLWVVQLQCHLSEGGATFGVIYPRVVSLQGHLSKGGTTSVSFIWD